MDDIHVYLQTLIRRSGLSKHEKLDWIEEMSVHLHDEIARLVDDGDSYNKAKSIAFKNFGDPKDIRRQIARETFGFSLSTIYSGALLCLALFFFSIYVVHESSPPGPMLSHWHESGWVRFFSQVVPLSPSFILALAIDFLMLTKTRRSIDRFALLGVTAVFGCMWVFARLAHHFSLGISLTFYSGRPLTLLDPMMSVGCSVLFGLGIVLYTWTRNTWVSVLPILLSLSAGLWPPVRDAVQSYLWQVTKMPTFWGHFNPFTGVEGIQIMITILIRWLLIGLLVLSFRLIDTLWNRPESLTSA